MSFQPLCKILLTDHDRIVAANDVAASTAQLVAASRVKADFMSQSQDRLESASKAVTSACRSLVKQVQEIIAAKNRGNGEEVNYSELSTHEFKMQEMEQQVCYSSRTGFCDINKIRLKSFNLRTALRRRGVAWVSSGNTRMLKSEIRIREVFFGGCRERLCCLDIPIAFYLILCWILQLYFCWCCQTVTVMFIIFSFTNVATVDGAVS